MAVVVVPAICISELPPSSCSLPFWAGAGMDWQCKAQMVRGRWDGAGQRGLPVGWLQSVQPGAGVSALCVRGWGMEQPRSSAGPAALGLWSPPILCEKALWATHSRDSFLGRGRAILAWETPSYLVGPPRQRGRLSYL